jgi:hypothetical protein
VQIAEAFDRDILNSGYHVSRVKLDNIPGKALIATSGRSSGGWAYIEERSGGVRPVFADHDGSSRKPTS